MKTQIVEGQRLAEKIEQLVATKLRGKKPQPSLHVVLAGTDLPSQIYIQKKEEACRRVGLSFQLHYLGEQASEAEVVALVKQLNQDSQVTSILLQLPLPPKMAKEEILEALDPEKDVDCLTPTNWGRFLTGHPRVIPATAGAVEEILRFYQVEVAGKKAVVVGRSQIVGLPVFISLQQMGATVTLCHSQTCDLGKETQLADILVTGVGERGLIKPGMIKEGAAVIDCGFSRQGKQVFGDVDPQVAVKAGLWTPVPGGVGPVTVACLLQNLLKLRQI